MNRKRSRVHMLNVAASRLESDHANPKLITDLREAAKAAASRIADGMGYSKEDEKRIERHRTLFAMLPSCNATDRLKDAMLQRAYDLLWDGDGLACDALLEFLPSNDIDRMFSAWDNDQSAGHDQPRSEFYEGRA